MPCTSSGEAPKVGILVDVEEAYAHCSKAFLRSDFWNPERFLARDRRFRRMAPEEPFDGTMLVGDYLTVLPQVHGVDGSFAARLEREQ